MPKILACTDGSGYATSVYDHAAWAAKRIPASIEVLHVLDHHRERAAMADISGNIGPDARDELMQQLTEFEEAQGKVAQRHSRAILEAAGNRLAEAGVTDVKLTHRHGTLVKTLAEFEEHSDLVIIGKRGETAGMAMQHLGANIERVIRSSHRPVLVTSRAFRPIESMLIAFDNGPSARKAVECAAQKPLLKGLKCHLLTVGKDSAETERKLTWAKEHLVKSGYEVETTVQAGDPEEIIARAVEEREISLLVMGAYGHSRIRQFIVGSTTTTMIRTCHVPVLMFR